MLSSGSMARKSSAAIFAPEEVAARVDALRLSPDEARWRVVERLLDHWDLSHPKPAPEPAPAPTAEIPA